MLSCELRIRRQQWIVTMSGEFANLWEFMSSDAGFKCRFRSSYVSRAYVPR